MQLLQSGDTTDVIWWHELSREAAGSAAIQDVVAVQCCTEGAVTQTNSSVLAFNLTSKEGAIVPVILKQVDLDGNTYRDAEHKARSQRSYAVERAFYTELANPLRHAGVLTAPLHASLWTEDGMRGVLVMGDLRHSNGATAPYSNDHGRSSAQRLALSETEARAALSWLARFHAACWQPPADTASASDPTAVGATQHSSTAAADQAADRCRAMFSAGSVWECGGYWSLDKRRSDLGKMGPAWERWTAAMAPTLGDAATTAAVQQLPLRLRDAAGPLDAALRRSCDEHGATLLHGDFKTANLFFHERSDPPQRLKASQQDRNVAASRPEDLLVSACDFQWVGRGLSVQDAVYLIWTSVAPEVVAEHESALFQHYCSKLNEALQRFGHAVVPQGVLDLQYEIAFLDYTRFLVGSMWGACTPESFADKAKDINQGMHKRSIEHHFRMVTKAAERVHQF